MTRDAVQVVGQQELHGLLRLDAIDTSAVVGMRERDAEKIAACEEQATRCDRLAELAAEFRECLAATVRADEQAWRRATRTRNSATDDEPLTIGADVHYLTSIVEAAARRIAAHAREDARHLKETRPHHEDKGVRADYFPEIGRQLTELRNRLQRADPRKWTVPALARLILASTDDWIIAPCPKLVSEYAPRELLARGRSRRASPLAEWIWSQLSRSPKRVSRRKRAKAPRT